MTMNFLRKFSKLCIFDANLFIYLKVATEKRKRQRAVLFGSGCEITRGLSARRDLALRRYLCHLPVAERTGHSRVAPQPSLFHAARALLMQAPVSG